MRNLAESGAIYQDTSGRWSASDTEGPLALPHSVRAVIGSRLARLGQESTKVLAIAAVIGREFDLDLLAAASGVDEDELLDLLDQAHRAALVTEISGVAGRYAFHALVQHALYEDLGTTRRTRVHKSVGEAIERLYGDHADDRIGELAHHFLLATRPSDAEKAIAYARRAGEVALGALAPDDAVRYFSQALELAGQTPTVKPVHRIDLLILLGVAQRQAGIASFRETLLAAAGEARDLGRAEQLVMAALANSRGLFSSLGQVDTQKVEILDAALEALPNSDSRERALLLATLSAELTFASPLERRLAMADESIGIARRLGDPGTLVDVINSSATGIGVPSTITRLSEDLGEAIAASRALADPARLFFSVFHARFVSVCMGRFEEASEHLAEMRDLAEDLHQPQFLWHATYFAASQALLHGDAATAEELATRALEIGSAGGQPDAFSSYSVQLIGIRHIQGRMGELVTLISDVADQNPTIPTFKASLAAACIDAGDEARARALFDKAAADGFLLPDDRAWSSGMARYAKVAIELNEPGGAHTIFGLLSAFHDQIPFNGLSPMEPVAMLLGGLATVLGRYEEAEAYFAEASALNLRGEMRYAEAQTDALRGRMLRERGEPADVEEARALLEQVRENAVRRGYARIERLATQELRSLA